MKKLYQLRTFLLMAVFSLIAGTAIAQTEVVFDFLQSADAYGSDVTPLSNVDLTAGTTTFTNGDVTFKYETKGGGTNLRWWSDGIRAYSGNEFSVNATDGEISSIAFEGTITVVETTSTGGSVSSNTWTAPAAGGVTSVTFKGNHTSKNKTITKITVTIASSNPGDTRVATTTSFPASAYSVKLGEAFTAPTATVVDANSVAVTSPAVTYESDNTYVATVDATTGAVTTVAMGSAKITATYEGGNDYKPSSASYTLTVTYPYVHAGTAEDPFTVEEGIAKAQEIGTTTDGVEYAVAGIISQVDSYNSKYSSITYWISDDGTTDNQMEVYSGKGLSSADFSSAEDLAVGYSVVVAGNLVNYQGNTPEFRQNNYLVSLDKNDGSVAAPTFSVAAGEVDANTVVTISAGEDCLIVYTTDGTDPTTSETAVTTQSNSVDVTITTDMTIRAIARDQSGAPSAEATAAYTIRVVIDAPEFSDNSRNVTAGTEVQFQITSEDYGVKIWYTTDGTDPTTSETATKSNRWYASVSLTINETTTIKAVATDGQGHFSDVVTLTYTVPLKAFGKVSSNSDITDGDKYLLVYEVEDAEEGAADAIVFSGEISSTSTTYGLTASTTRAADGTIDVTGLGVTPVVINAATNGFTMKVGDSYLAWSSGNSLKLQDDEFVWAIDVENETELAHVATTDGERYLIYNVSSPRFAAYANTTSVKGVISLYKEGFTSSSAETVSVTIGSTGYATLYYSDKDLSIPEGVTAYIVYVEKGVAQTEAIAKGEDIPFGTGVVLEATPGTYEFTVADGTKNAWLFNQNLLRGLDEEGTPVGYNATDKLYKLSLDNNGANLGFYLFAEGEKTGAHKAYLAVPSDVASGIRAFLLNGDVVSGISLVNGESTQNGNAYDLSGRRVKNADKGLYIVNGKKVIK